jgi:hypothetical protein
VAVAVVDLDAGGVIDDVEAVVTIDGDGAGPDEVAVLNAFVAPDQLRLGVGTAAAREGRQQADAKAGESASEEHGHQVLAFG